MCKKTLFTLLCVLGLFSTGYAYFNHLMDAAGVAITSTNLKVGYGQKVNLGHYGGGLLPM